MGLAEPPGRADGVGFGFGFVVAAVAMGREVVVDVDVAVEPGDGGSVEGAVPGLTEGKSATVAEATSEADGASEPREAGVAVAGDPETNAAVMPIATLAIPSPPTIARAMRRRRSS